MGARTSWMLTTDETAENAIHLYSHYGAETKLEDTRNALRACLPRVKMGDASYSARIFISQIVGDFWGIETGFGILAGDVYGWPFDDEAIFVKIDFALDWVTVGAQHWTGTIAEFVLSSFDVDAISCPTCRGPLNDCQICEDCDYWDGVCRCGSDTLGNGVA